MRYDHSFDTSRSTQPCQINRSWAEYIFDHLAHKPTNVLTGRRVVQEHAVLDQRVVGLRNPPSIVLVQVHPEDVNAHLPSDDQKGDDQEWGKPSPPASSPVLSGPIS